MGVAIKTEISQIVVQVRTLPAPHFDIFIHWQTGKTVDRLERQPHLKDIHKHNIIFISSGGGCGFRCPLLKNKIK